MNHARPYQLTSPHRRRPGRWDQEVSRRRLSSFGSMCSGADLVLQIWEEVETPRVVVVVTARLIICNICFRVVRLLSPFTHAFHAPRDRRSRTPSRGVCSPSGQSRLDTSLCWLRLVESLHCSGGVSSVRLDARPVRVSERWIFATLRR